MVKIKDTKNKNKELKEKNKKKKQKESIKSSSQTPKKIKIIKKKKEVSPVRNGGDLAVHSIDKGTRLYSSPPQETKISNGIKSKRYYQAIGRRKRAVARIRLFVRGEKAFLVNDKPYNIYFSDLRLQQIAISSLNKMNSLDRFRILIKVKGGGIHSQAEATRHAISRALILLNPNFKKRLRKAGYLTRDPRERERKKFGLKRARRAPQWRKR